MDAIAHAHTHTQHEDDELYPSVAHTRNGRTWLQEGSTKYSNPVFELESLRNNLAFSCVVARTLRTLADAGIRVERTRFFARDCDVQVVAPSTTAMPGNSSVAAKKRSLNGTRRRTKQRLLKEQARFSGGGVLGGKRRSSPLLTAKETSNNAVERDPTVVALHEANIGLAKRRTLYAHMKNVRPTRSKKKKLPQQPEVFSPCANDLSRECYVFVDATRRQQALVQQINALRKARSTGRRRAKVVVVLQQKKAAEKLAPLLGWNGTNAEVWTTEKTAKWGFGSIKRVRECVVHAVASVHACVVRECRYASIRARPCSSVLVRACTWGSLRRARQLQWCSGATCRGLFS